MQIRFFGYRPKMRLARKYGNVIMPLDQIKAILIDPRAIVIASCLHYSLFLLAIDNIT
jgi:hypothetical protein